MDSKIWSQDNYINTLRFAAQAHLGQTLPGSELPYTIHLNLVAMEVMAALRFEPGMDENLAIQCALLHDVIEDTSVTYEQVMDEFGLSAAQGVLALTKDLRLDKSLQMKDSLSRIHQQPREIWMVKMADRITNLQPPPAKWTSVKIAAYREEALLIYEFLQEGNVLLAQRLLNKIQNY